MRVFVVLLIFSLAACTDRHLFQSVPVPDTAFADQQRLFVATTRAAQDDGQIANAQRGETLHYLSYDVSIPKAHTPGKVEWPRGKPDPAAHFALTDAQSFATAREFSQTLVKQGTGRETFVFVHGFNTSHPEAVYRAAQMLHDFDVPGPGVLYSWPSAGRVAAYVYDRDSVLVARDGLADLLELLTRDGRKVGLVGHSMGSYLIMESLRRLAATKPDVIRNRIAAVLLISPDLDTEVFRAQSRAIGRLPRPFYIVGTPQDRALRVSALLTGKKGRLGSLQDPGALTDLGVTELDLTALSSGEGGDHSIAFSSPSAIATLNSLNERYDLTNPDGEAGVLLLDQLLPGLLSPLN